ncbi:hypothetical protein KY284_003505 [Solanum tuberosum]|nr:hypothetical protein KY284_003505 [Solanum tuberosum]
MAKYKIKNNFNCKVKRSDRQRPIVVVNGVHLGGAYKMTFVSVAYGIVETENDCLRTWFFEQFKNAFGEREEMCVVSDRNESIIKSNVCGNFKRSRNILSDLFYSMAKTYINEDFDKLMAKVDKVNHKVKEYLEDAGYEK